MGEGYFHHPSYRPDGKEKPSHCGVYHAHRMHCTTIALQLPAVDPPAPLYK